MVDSEQISFKKRLQKMCNQFKNLMPPGRLILNFLEKSIAPRYSAWKVGSETNSIQKWDFKNGLNGFKN